MSNFEQQKTKFRTQTGFIAALDQGAEVGERLGGSVAAALFAAQHGAQILRVHDVAETRQALTVQTALLDV